MTRPELRRYVAPASAIRCAGAAPTTGESAIYLVSDIDPFLQHVRAILREGLRYVGYLHVDDVPGDDPIYSWLDEAQSLLDALSTGKETNDEPPRE